MSTVATRLNSAADAVTLAGQDTPQPLLYELAGGTCAVVSTRSPDKHTANEDAAALVPLGEDAAVLAVADGVGGLPAGEAASSTALNELSNALSRATDDPAEVRVRVLNGIEQANQTILSDGGGSATTIAALEIRGRDVRAFHVGDSEILIVGQRGRVKLQTVSHSPVGFAVEAGLLDADEALHHEDRHLVSNVVGSTDMRIEMGVHTTLATFDTVLLGSDGLFDNLHLDEIIDTIRKGPLQIAAQRLLAATLARMTDPNKDEPSKPDDMTFVVFRRHRD